MKREIIPASEEHENDFRKHWKLKDEFKNDPECQSAYEYAATTKLYPDEMNFIGAIIEPLPHKEKE
jgi:hypothetical protein